MQFPAVGGQPFISATATSLAGNTSEFSNHLSYDNPGNFGFSSANYAVAEDLATATITINRINGAVGSACVNYATSNGTATAGSDYTTAAGTVCFAVGELSKTFDVSILPDATPEADETVTLTLSNPTNGSGLAAQSTATLAIVNEDSFVTFVVNNNGDTDDGACSEIGTGNGCTLREAINAANVTPEQDTIAFALIGENPTITITAALPAITARLLINGNTGGATRVEINGNGVAADGLTLSGSSGRSRIYRLVINRFNGTGIYIIGTSNHIIQGNFIGTDSTGTVDLGNADGGITFDNSRANLIGGTTGTTPGGACTGVCNLISGNGSHGISGDSRGGAADANVIQGNFIGTDVTGTAALGNSGRGITFLNAVHNTLIGGSSPNARNLISGNSELGVFMSAAHVKGNLIQGNYIGVNTTADAKIPNGRGVVVFFTATQNSIIGNVISGNALRGIELSTFGAPAELPPHGNIVQGNFIGTDPSGTLDLGNGQSGITDAVGGIVLIQGTYNNDIGGPAPGQGNVIAFNYGAGIRLGGSPGGAPAGVGNSILNNSIYSNEGLGIALFDGAGVITGRIGNDSGDGDTGPNNRQNSPVLSSATSGAGGMVSVTGSLNSIANTEFTIEFFVSSAADPTGSGEGQTFLGSRTVTTNNSGDATFAPFTYRRIVGKTFISATATNNLTGDTSEFSPVVTDPTPSSNAPVVNATDVNATLNQPATVSATFTDSDGPAPYTATIECGNGTPASNVTVDTTSGTVSGTCTYTALASYTVSITVFDNYGVSATDTAGVTVNAAPTANSGSLTTDEDTAVNGTLSGSDPEGSSLSFEIVSNPTSGSLSNFDPATGSFTYTPDTNANGTDSFTFRVSDGAASSGVATISITVNAVNDPPVTNSASLPVDEDDVAIGTLPGGDVDSTVTFEIMSNPTKGALSDFNSTTGRFTYTPNANENGSDSFTFRLSDGTANSSVETISITITAVNDAPTMSDRFETVAEDGSLPMVFSGSDIDGDAMSYSIVSGPTNGTLTGTTANRTYTPNPNFSGTDSFTYTASDGTADSNVATMTITVDPINDPPVANAQSVTVDEDSSVSITLGGSDIENDALTFSIVSQPTNGTVTGTGANVTYTPNANYSGSDSFTFTARDAEANSNIATIAITVADVPEPSPTPATSPTPAASPTPVASPGPSASPFANPTPGRAINISTRVQVGTGENAMIGGFIVTGTAPKKVIVRGIGPSLAAENVPGPLADPVLALHGPDGSRIVSNDNWKETQQSAIEATNLAPENDLESAIIATLQPGAYTAILSGRGDTTGAALVEIYDLDSPAQSGLSNISTRGQVQGGEGFMIGGFMLDVDNSGSEVVIRALGPSLTADRITIPLADPTLDLRDANGERLVFNDDWSDDAIDAAAVTSLGLAPTGATESAIAVSLPPGAYTAIVASGDDSAGVALIEVYVVK